jgi:hypothetical protein
VCLNTHSPKGVIGQKHSILKQQSFNCRKNDLKK